MHTLLLTNFIPPLSQTVTNLGPRSLKYVTFSTYKFAIAKYNLNFKLKYNHLFTPLNLWFLQNEAYHNFKFLFESMYHTLNYWHGRKLIEEWHWRSAEYVHHNRKLKHHDRRLNFRFYMRNKKIKIICAWSSDPSHLPTATFSQTPPSPGAWSTLCTAVNNL